MEQSVVIKCQCSPTLIRMERLLRELKEEQALLSDAVDNIYTTFESLDAISDVTVGLKDLENKLKTIAMED
jgi:hypothetical protein